MAELIRQDPGFKVNMDLGSGCTLLQEACQEDSNSAVIPLLLAHPEIDVNVKDKDGSTPFYSACWNGSTSCVREMLKDFKVKVNEPDNDGYTPLYWAAVNGRLDVIEWCIASGREMDLGKPGELRSDAIGIAKKGGKTEVVALLERFKSDAAKTRSEVRKELGTNGQYYSCYSYYSCSPSYSYSYCRPFSFSVHHFLHFYPTIFTFNLIVKNIEFLSLSLSPFE